MVTVRAYPSALRMSSSRYGRSVWPRRLNNQHWQRETQANDILRRFTGTAAWRNIIIFAH